MAQSLKGVQAAAALYAQIAADVQSLLKRGVVPCLAIIRVGARDDDVAYENSIIRRCEALGVAVRVHALPEAATQEALLETLALLNADASVHGCLPLRPLPSRFDDGAVRNALSPEKDVDGITDASLASVFVGGATGFPPCTPCACMELLSHYGVSLAGRRAVVVGRSLVVGKPLAMLLLEQNATVTVCHTKTENLPAVCRKADVLLVAAGRAGVVGRDCFSPGQTVIDVGYHTDAYGNACGDIDFSEAERTVAAVTPVPGGVGPVTTAVLMQHVVQAALRQTER